MRKEKVIEAINSFPPEFELEELIEKLIFMEKVEKGLAQLDKGDVKTQDEVKKLVKTWRK
jgi:predicted transcriptional regulator